MRRLHSGPATALVVIATLGAAAGDGWAQDPAPTVSELVITAPAEVPVPQIGPGAPLFSPAEIAEVGRKARLDASEALSNARRCSSAMMSSDIGTATSIRKLLAAAYRSEQQADRALLVAAEAAQAASQKAREDRQAGARGARTEEQLQISELQRQIAVRKYIAARAAAEAAGGVVAKAQRLIKEAGSLYADEFSILAAVRGQLLLAGPRPTGDPVITLPADYSDLVLEDIVVRQREDRSGVFLQVSGKIRNARNKAVATPALSVTAVDVSGFPLKTETADGRGRIKAGAAIPFQYVLRPKPSQAQTVVVALASRARPPMTLPAGMRLLTPGEDPDARSLDCSDGTLDPLTATAF